MAKCAKASVAKHQDRHKEGATTIAQTVAGLARSVPLVSENKADPVNSRLADAGVSVGIIGVL